MLIKEVKLIFLILTLAYELKQFNDIIILYRRVIQIWNRY